MAFLNLPSKSTVIETIEVSKELTISGLTLIADSTAAITQCGFVGLICQTDNTNNVTINIFDARTATGKKVIPTNFVVLASESNKILMLPKPIQINNGIYVDITTSGTTAISIYYIRT